MPLKLETIDYGVNSKNISGVLTSYVSPNGFKVETTTNVYSNAYSLSNLFEPNMEVGNYFASNGFVNPSYVTITLNEDTDIESVITHSATGYETSRYSSGIVEIYKNGVWSEKGSFDTRTSSKIFIGDTIEKIRFKVTLVGQYGVHFSYIELLENVNYDDILLKSNNKIYSLKSDEIKYETKMTSNVAPVPFIATSSSQYNTTLIPFRAFNGINKDANAWVTINNTKTGWIQIDYGADNFKKVNCIYVTNRNNAADFATSAPKDFNILGSNDGVEFIKLKEVRNQTDWKQNETRKFLLSKIGNYRIYRLEILDNNGATYTAIGEILYSYISILTEIPSDSIDNFIKYGSPSIDNFNLINDRKNYILTQNNSQNQDGLLVTQINRKPLSIKIE